MNFAALPPTRNSGPRRQRGIITAIAAVILIAAVLFVLQQTYGIIGTTSDSNSSQSDSIAAFFLAESGVEQAKGILAAASNQANSTECAGLFLSGVFPTSRGSFSRLSGVSAPSGCTNDCTSCTITSTGTVGSASRTVEVVMSVTPPSGGASGYGGGGCFDPANDTGTPANPIHNYVTTTPCPFPPPDGDLNHITIDQSVKVDNAPVILLSNMAYSRKSPTTQEHIYAGACVTVPASGGCFTRWNTQSKAAIGAGVVGSRGASDVITANDTYTFSQSLTGHSGYAAVSGSFGGKPLGPPPAWVGAYWDDETSSTGDATAAGSATTQGKTNNGAACATPGVPDLATCPDTSSPGNLTTYSTKQEGKSWCYDADTLVFGFSGSSKNGTGSSSTFKFGDGPDPNGTLLVDGFVEYPKHTASTPSDIYSTMYWLHNTYFRSSNAGAGATSYTRAVKGTLGATFDGQLIKDSTTMTVSNLVGTLCNGDKITGSNDLGGTGKSSTIATTGCSSSNGTYTLADTSSKSSTALLTAASNSFRVIGTTGGSLTAANAYEPTSNTNFTVLSGPSLGAYTLSAQTTLNGGAPIVLTQGASTTTITLPAGDITGLDGTYIAVSSGNGKFEPQTKIATVLSATQFTVDKPPPAGITDALICGGICAFFDHASPTTNFTITNINTGEWAGGFTCLKGIDKNTIKGLRGNTDGVKATRWREQVR